MCTQRSKLWRHGDGFALRTRNFAACGCGCRGADNPAYATNAHRLAKEEEIYKVRFGARCVYRWPEGATGKSAASCKAGWWMPASTMPVDPLRALEKPSSALCDPGLALSTDEHLRSCAVWEMQMLHAQVIGDWVSERSMDDVLAAMKEAAVPSGPILSTADIFREEQYQARNMFHVTKPPSGAGYCPALRSSQGAGCCMRGPAPRSSVLFCDSGRGRTPG